MAAVVGARHLEQAGRACVRACGRQKGKEACGGTGVRSGNKMTRWGRMSREAFAQTEGTWWFPLTGDREHSLHRLLLTRSFRPFHKHLGLPLRGHWVLVGKEGLSAGCLHRARLSPPEKNCPSQSHPRAPFLLSFWRTREPSGLPGSSGGQERVCVAATLLLSQSQLYPMSRTFLGSFPHLFLLCNSMGRTFPLFSSCLGSMGDKQLWVPIKMTEEGSKNSWREFKVWNEQDSGLLVHCWWECKKWALATSENSVGGFTKQNVY